MPRRTREQLKRSKAAQKGWETRRARAQALEQARARRSAAARKGWETRKMREREEWPLPDTFTEFIVEEPIDTVGGKYYE